MRFALLALCLAIAPVVVSPVAGAQERPAVVVTPGSARNFKIAVQDFADLSATPDPTRAATFRASLEEALEFSGLFRPLSHDAFLGSTASGNLDGSVDLVCSDWSQIGADALLEGTLETGTEFAAEFRLWDTARCSRLARKRYAQPATSDPAQAARRIADDVVAAFVGLRGVSSTEIAFVSNRGGNPEIYVMGATGANQRRATSNRSLNNFPEWSPEGDAIVYTSYRYQNRPLLFLSSRGRGRPGRLLHRLGGDRAEYRGVFSPRGDRLAVVMSEPGQSSDIYTVHPDGKGLRRLTRQPSIEVAPSWSPDGEQIAFVSDRAGSPQVYVMNADGSNQRRLTFQGNYNTHPAWSPDGRWIAYESRIGGQFDIWLTDPEGTVVLPLVQHPRTDESPAWAPNGRRLVFTSKRRGRADIYVVDANGDNLRRITSGEGDNTSPSWGPFPR